VQLLHGKDSTPVSFTNLAVACTTIVSQAINYVCLQHFCFLLANLAAARRQKHGAGKSLAGKNGW
jgi:hypothetical protein